MTTPSNVGTAMYGDSPGSLLANASEPIVPMPMQSAAFEKSRQKPRTGRGTTIIEPIRRQATAAAAMATGPPA
jgi:hypothetical protein